MIEKMLFLQQNKELHGMLQGDLSLRKIATVAEMQQAKQSGYFYRHVAVPGFLHPREYQQVVPYTNIEFYKVYLYMIVNDKQSYEFSYYNMSDQRVRQLVEKAKTSFDEVCVIYPEFFTFFHAVNIEVMVKGNKTKYSEVKFRLTYVWKKLDFSGSYSFQDIQDTIYACAFAISELRRYGKIGSHMSQYERARVLFQWVVFHAEYSKTYKGSDFTPKGFLFNGVGVCQAYTGVFNLLCKMEQIPVIGIAGQCFQEGAITGEEHIWSFVILDGKCAYVDSTWADTVFSNEHILYKYGINPEDICNFKYFYISRQELSKTHKWSTVCFEDMLINQLLIR